ncbi:MAG: DUF2062 domain-containing protein [Burkholderiales bacterium]
MLRRLIARFTGRLQPAIDKVTQNPTVQRYFPALADPDLWHVNRRSAARAVAVGLFCGLIPGPLQVLGAIACCLVVRANFPISIVTTFYTNPFTIVPLYVVAYEYGRVVFPDAPPTIAWTLPHSAGVVEWMPALFHWMAQLGKPLAVGLVLLAVTLAAVGWAVVRLAWRCHAVWAWRRRSRLRAGGARP